MFKILKLGRPLTSCSRRYLLYPMRHHLNFEQTLITSSVREIQYNEVIKHAAGLFNAASYFLLL